MRSLLCLLVLLCTGCASSEMYDAAPKAEASRGVSGGLDLAWAVNDTVAEGSGSTEVRARHQNVLGQGRILIRTASIGLDVDDIEETVQQIVELVKGLGGYVESASSHSKDRANLRIRVPSSGLDSALDELAELGDEQSRSLGSQDVTEQVADINNQLKNKRALRDRLRKLLDKAKDVKDVLAIEKQLNRVQIEVESLEGRLKRIKEDVALSAVDVSLHRPTVLGPLGYLGYGFYWVFKKLFILRD